MSSGEQRPQTLHLFALPHRTPSVRLSVCLAGWLTEVSSHVPELICCNRPGRGQLCQRYTSAPRTADFFFFFCTSRLLRADAFLWRSCQVTRGQRCSPSLIRRSWPFPSFVKQNFILAYCFIIVCSVKNFPGNQRCWLSATQNSRDTTSTVPSNIFPFFFLLFLDAFFFPFERSFPCVLLLLSACLMYQSFRWGVTGMALSFRSGELCVFQLLRQV